MCTPAWHAPLCNKTPRISTNAPHYWRITGRRPARHGKPPAGTSAPPSGPGSPMPPRGCGIGSACVACCGRSRTPRKLAARDHACVWNLNLAAARHANRRRHRRFRRGPALGRRGWRRSGASGLHGAYGCALGLVGGDSDDYVRYCRKRRDSPTRPTIRAADRATRLSGVRQHLRRLPRRRARVLRDGLPDAAGGTRARCAVHRLQPLSRILMVQAWLLARIGRLDESTAVCDRAEQLARAHGDVEVLTWMQLARIEGTLFAAMRPPRATTPMLRWRRARKPPPRNHSSSERFILGMALRLDAAWNESIARLQRRCAWRPR